MGAAVFDLGHAVGFLRGATANNATLRTRKLGEVSDADMEPAAEGTVRRALPGDRLYRSGEFR